MLLDQRAADRLQIVARVEPLGDLADVLPKRLAVAQICGARELIDLGAGVVDVIFARHVEAGEGEQTGERIAEHGTPAMADMHWPGRVGRDIFDIDHAALADGAPAVSLALLEHHAQQGKLRPDAFGQREIDEAWTGDLNLLDIGVGGEQRHDALGKRAGRHTRRSLASTMAALVARSPWPWSLGASRLTPAMLASAGTTPSCFSCWMAAST